MRLSGGCCLGVASYNSQEAYQDAPGEVREGMLLAAGKKL
jgi:hypothetical protein